MEVEKGIIQKIDGTTATVIPSEHPDIVTRPLVVPFYWRETMGNLQAGDEVYFLEDDAHGGYIIGRTDGNWDNILRGKLTITEDVTAQASVAITANVTAGGSVTATGDVKGSGKSLAGHTHTDSQGGNTSSAK